MLKLFQPDSPRGIRLNVFPRVEYVRQRLTNNLARVVNFYRFKQRPVRSNHPLVRLVESFAFPYNIDPVRYATLANYAAPSIARTLGYGSPITALKLQPSVFYGQGVEELVFCDTMTDLFDVQLPNWKDVRAVQVLSHPKTDLSFQVLTKENSTPEAGIATVKIDIALLAYQYQQWRISQISVPNGERQTTGHFIGMYVLPNMLYSHLDVAWLNRLHCHQLGVSPATTIRNTALALPSTMTYVDDVLELIVETYDRRQGRWAQMWDTIPTPTSELGVLADSLILPKWPPTRYAKAFTLVTTLPWIEFLLSMDVVHDATINSKYYTELRRTIQRAKSERWLDGIQGDRTALKARLDRIVEQHIGE